MEKEAKAALAQVMFLVGLFTVLFAVVFSSTIQATTSGNSTSSNLTIWDDTDLLIKLSNAQINFSANFTNMTGEALNATNGISNCTLRFDFTGTYTSYENMSFDSSLIWTYNRTFDYKGTHQFQVNCTSTAGNVTLNESFVITNTAPAILTTSGGTYVDFDGNTGTYDYWLCTEDTLCTYNFSANITEPDVNDVLIYGVSSTNTTLTGYTLGSTTGILDINITNNSINGVKQIRLEVRDSDLGFDSKILRVNISSLNDAPQFVNISNQTMNISESFEYFINITDEENNIPFTYNITFLNCTVAEWSTRNCSNSTGKELFNSSQYTTNTTAGWINISFIPDRNDVGDYVIMFNVTDLSNNLTPYNATTSRIINFTVLNVNEIPYFTYTCDNERNTTENSLFTCDINVTDIDEIDNLTFTANYTWFHFNSTQSNWTQVLTNSTFNYNTTGMVNFTATDSSVGNWSVNITVTDKGSPQRSNSTTFYFYIDNVNDTVTITNISNVTVYTSSTSVQISINATDDDLLIPDKSVYNESLNFTTNNANFAVSTYITVANMTYANISLNPSGLEIGNHTINVTVVDLNNNSIDSTIFTVQVLGNNAPQWNETMITELNLTEDVEFYLNLSLNVTDDDADTLNFSFVNNSNFAFPSFNSGFNLNTGVINFTPVDEDVGYHNITITITDGKSFASLEFNFTVYNVNDNPGNIVLSVSNASITNYNITAQEDNYTAIYLQVEDDDYKIHSSQTSFYSEDVTINLTIQGPNTTLFSFGAEYAIPPTNGNKTQANAIFTPRKISVGSYNITMNVTDASNASTYIDVNLTILEIMHAPNMTNIENQVLSILNETFSADVNATDSEDGNDGSPTNLTFVLTNLTSGGNFLTINSSTGVINFTFNQTYAGLWQFNISVNDTDGMWDSDLFNLTVYDYPSVLFPNSIFQFNLQENVSHQLNFTVNHSVQDNVTYTLIINGDTRNSISGYGNATEFLWNFTADFSDETCSGAVNLTLNVSNSKLSNLTTWNVTINHTNYPLAFASTIPNQSGGSPLSITLSSYFTDPDASDSCVIQNITFNYALVNGSSSIAVSIVNWTNSTPTATFTGSGTEEYYITGLEHNSSNNSQVITTTNSNNFSVELTISTSPTQTPSSGGGSSTETIIVSLKIIVPEPVSAKQKDKLIIPLGIVNDGEKDLNKILLSAVVAKDGLLRKDLIASFDTSFFDKLKVGERENVTLIVDIDTSATGLFEVTINGTVEDPEYSDWAKFYIEIEEEEDILERIIFTEEFIIGNPECAEFADLIKEAKSLFAQGKQKEALQKAEDSLEACKRAISQPSIPRIYERFGDTFFSYAAIASLIAIALGFAYYYYKKIKLKRQLMGYQKNFNNHPDLISV
ncbi:MAG: hypothetical protein KJ718_00615 [Nanoarchaeota archaeon]|nr:hypothetical protein [Nanoarchaeota archaeon]MBU1051043.1 hypothetical protein [Nanoarchaeota archaeon]MBU1989035.1 hypothetical protein [Nanoarchaeota archaeon]